MSDILPDSLLVVNGGYYQIDLNHSLYEFKLSDFVSIPDTNIRNSFAFTINLNVPPNTSFVNNTEEHVLDAGDAELKVIRIKSGGILLKVYNPLATKTLFTIQLPGVTKNNTTLSEDFVAPAGTPSNPGMVTSYVDLSGYTADLKGINGNGFNIIQSKMLVKSDPNGPAVQVTTADTIKFDASLSDVKIDYARGYFGSSLVSDTLTSSLAIFNNFQSGVVDINAIDLDVIIENGFKVASRFKINQLKNTNNDGTTVALSHPIIGNWMTINSASGSGTNLVPSTNTYAFTGGNSNLEQFVENHGASMVFDYQLQLNPWGNTSGGWDEIYDEYPLRIKMAGTIPLAIGLDNLVFMDTFKLDLKQDPNKTHIQSGKFLIQTFNAFPFQGELELTLLNSSFQPIATLPASAPIASSLSGAMLNGIMQKTSNVEINIPESIIDLLDQVKHCQLRLKLNTPDATNSSSVQVAIPEYAFLKFNLKTKFILETHL